jgi:hypothetical protein
MPRLAAPDAVADRWVQERQPYRPPPAQAVQLLPLVSSPSQQEQPRIHPGTYFSPTPQGGFCTPWAAGSIATSKKVVSAVPAETTYEDRPLTSSALLPRPVLGGEPCGGCLRPWLAVSPVGNSTLYSSTLVQVYKLLFIQ